MSLRAIRRQPWREDLSYFLILAVVFSQLFIGMVPRRATSQGALSVIAFPFETRPAEAPEDLANAVRDAIVAEMIQTGKWTVRTAYSDDPSIQRAFREGDITEEEIELTLREPTVERAVRWGKLVGADLVLLGAVEEYKYEEADGGKVTITASARLISVETSQPVENGDVRETVTQIAKKPPVEVAKEVLLKQAVLDLAKVIVQRFLGKPRVVKVEKPKKKGIGVILPLVLLAALVGVLASGGGGGERPTAPTTGAPRSVTVIPQLNGVMVAWQPPQVGEPTQYRIYRSQAGMATTRKRAAKGGYQALDTVPATQLSYLDTSTVPGALYRYAVSAIYPDGRESPPTEPPPDGSGLPPAVGARIPTAPRNFQGTPGDGWVKLTWERNPEDYVIGYRLFRLDTPRDLLPTDRPIADETQLPRDITQFVDDNNGQGLERGRPYYYRLVAVSSATFESVPTVLVSVIPGDYPPQPPRNLRAIGLDGQIRLQWDPSPDVDVVKYQILRGEQPIGAGRSPHLRVIRRGPMPPNVKFAKLRRKLSRIRAPQMSVIAEVEGRLNTQYIDTNVVNAQVEY
ncbi:MAG TPA: hypothetical protein EYP10_12545, partial [Armatimonadetes bacterium]|nr:hypothetical protein [Armatimonadota bacterium]